MKKYLQTIGVLAVSQFKSLTRNYLYLFFMVAMPLMFLTVFGALNSSNSSEWKVAIFNNAQTEVGKNISEGIFNSVVKTKDNDKGLFLKQDAKDMAEAEEKLVRAEIDAILVVPNNFGEIKQGAVRPGGQIEVVYRPNSDSGPIAANILESILSEVDLKSGREPANFTVKSVESKRQGLKRFDYIFAGMLAYNIMMFGLMGLSNAVPEDKKTGALKRIHASPVTSAQYLAAYALAFMAIAVISMSLMIIEAIFVFNWQMAGSWINMIVFMFISLIMMFGTGLIVGGYAKDEQQASGLANAMMFPLMFLSGVFFPRFMMPEALRAVSEFIPLTPVNDGIRLIITENYNLTQLIPQLLLIAGWTVILYAIAIKVFRWDSNTN